MRIVRLAIVLHIRQAHAVQRLVDFRRRSSGFFQYLGLACRDHGFILYGLVQPGWGDNSERTLFDDGSDYVTVPRQVAGAWQHVAVGDRLRVVDARVVVHVLPAAAHAQAPAPNSMECPYFARMIRS